MVFVKPADKAKEMTKRSSANISVQSGNSLRGFDKCISVFIFAIVMIALTGCIADDRARDKSLTLDPSFYSKLDPEANAPKGIELVKHGMTPDEVTLALSAFHPKAKFELFDTPPKPSQVFYYIDKGTVRWVDIYFDEPSEQSEMGVVQIVYGRIGLRD